jgi:hypothetical protein
MCPSLNIRSFAHDHICSYSQIPKISLDAILLQQVSIKSIVWMFFKEFTNFVIFNVMCYNLPTKLLVYQVCPIGLFKNALQWLFIYIYIYWCMKIFFSHLLTLELDIVFLDNYFTRYLNDIHGVAIVHSIVVLICATHDGRI